MANLLVKIVIFASLFVFAIFCAEFGDISVFAFFVLPQAQSAIAAAERSMIGKCFICLI